MNIEYNFLQKAIKDRNYICFIYENKRYEMIKVFSLNENNFKTNNNIFELKKIKKLQILKQSY